MGPTWWLMFTAQWNKAHSISSFAWFQSNREIRSFDCQVGVRVLATCSFLCFIFLFHFSLFIYLSPLSLSLSSLSLLSPSLSLSMSTAHLRSTYLIASDNNFEFYCMRKSLPKPLKTQHANIHSNLEETNNCWNASSKGMNSECKWRMQYKNEGKRVEKKGKRKKTRKEIIKRIYRVKYQVERKCSVA